QQTDPPLVGRQGERGRRARQLDVGEQVPHGLPYARAGRSALTPSPGAASVRPGGAAPRRATPAPPPGPAAAPPPSWRAPRGRRRRPAARRTRGAARGRCAGTTPPPWR